MTEINDRVHNLKWFADLKVLLLNNSGDIDQTIEDIYQLTRTEFKK